MSAFGATGPAPVFGRGVCQTFLVVGICSALFGAAVLIWPDKTAARLGLLIGMYLLVAAVLQATVALGARWGVFPRILLLLSAGVSAALGLLSFRNGGWVTLLAIWLGLAWTVRGAVQASAAVWEDGYLSGSGRQELVGLATMLGGIAIALIPFTTIDTLALAAGSGMIVLGVTEVLAALHYME